MPAKTETKEIAIKAVRNNRSSIHVEWNQGNDEFAVTFHDQPLPGFYKALEALVPHACTLAEFPVKDAEKIEATGVTLREKGDNVLALITAKKKLKRNGRVLNVATPILAMYADDEDKAADHMTADEAAAIEKFVKEAKRYVVGERAQGQLPLGSDEETDGKGSHKKETADNTTPFPGMGSGASAANG